MAFRLDKRPRRRDGGSQIGDALGMNLVRSPRLLLLVACHVLVCALPSACAHIEENESYRIDPLERARTSRVETGHGLGVAGSRLGLAVQAQVFDVSWCALEHRQRARGWRRVERVPVGQSLTIEWAFGGLFTATSASLIALNTLSPPAHPEASLRSQSSGYVFAGAVGAIGLGLLTGAIVQQASLGRHDTDLGEKEIEKRDPDFVCKREPAHGGRVRLTLADGMQVEADADQNGLAVLPLPADIESRLTEGRRATLEAIGDPRAQVRIPL